MSLRLHPTLGVNPHLTVCRRCGGESQELMLIGARNVIDRCDDCGATVYGGIASLEGCPSCQSRTGNKTRIGIIGEHDRLPSTEPCDKCKKELEEHKQIVASGGVYFRCLECKQSGVIKPGDYASAVRRAHKLTHGEPCGIEFTHCAEHSTKE